MHSQHVCVNTHTRTPTHRHTRPEENSWDAKPFTSQQEHVSVYVSMNTLGHTHHGACLATHIETHMLHKTMTLTTGKLQEIMWVCD